MNEHFSIRVSRGDTTVEVAGDREFVEEKFNNLVEEYLTQAESTSQNPIPSQTMQSEKPKQASLAEIYTSADISYKRDAALLVGWFLEKMENQNDFIKSEIEERALQAKVELGANLSRDISTLIEKGLVTEIDRRDGEKSYYLTRSGESYVEDEFGIAQHIN